MNELKFGELQVKIIQWADEKGLFLGASIEKQKLKLFEEIGELTQGIIKSDTNLIKDSIGDIIVVIVILCEQQKRLILDVVTNERSTNIYTDLLKIVKEFKVLKKEIYPIFEIIKIANALNVDYLECLNIAWSEIKDRKGTLVNGSFVKNK